MSVQFYLPEAHLPSKENRAAWMEGGDLVLEEGGKSAASQSWIYKTWIALSKKGCLTELVHNFPESGVVFALSGTIPTRFWAPEGMLLVDVVADGLPHAAAHVHIVQNAAHARRMPCSIFMPHWPQPGLQVRDPQRGAKCERVAFFGTRDNLAPELQDASWQEELKRRTGILFEIRGAGRWHDYRNVDAVVAIRDFTGGKQIHKPATKLYNAWLAEVPFIGGTDSAYAADGSAGQDYLVARGPAEVVRHLELLARDQVLRNSLVEEGRKKAVVFNAESTACRWQKLVELEIPSLARSRATRPRWIRACEDFCRLGVCEIDRIFRS